VSNEEAEQWTFSDRDRPGQGQVSPPSPDPAREALDKPHLGSEELEKEIGDSDPWDEASEDAGEES
jgi:hypothetical protein